jgi:hypothetical protein
LIVPEPVTTPSPGHLLRLHAEVGAIMLDEHVIFFEAALIEQHLSRSRAVSRPFLCCASIRACAAAEPRLRAASSSSIGGRHGESVPCCALPEILPWGGRGGQIAAST